MRRRSQMSAFIMMGWIIVPGIPAWQFTGAFDLGHKHRRTLILSTHGITSYEIKTVLGLSADSTRCPVHLAQGEVRGAAYAD